MYSAAMAVMGSAAGIVFLLIVFSIEAHRGRRFGERVRGWLDRVVAETSAWCARTGRSLERDVLRQSIHFLFHQFLRLILFVIRFTERNVDALLRTNKAVARRAARAHTLSFSKLEEMVSHKTSTALSDEERRAHKERSVGTRL